MSFMSSSGDIGEGGTNPVTGTNEPSSCPGCRVSSEPVNNIGDCTYCLGRNGGHSCSRRNGGSSPSCSPL